MLRIVQECALQYARLVLRQIRLTESAKGHAHQVLSTMQMMLTESVCNNVLHPISRTIRPLGARWTVH